MAPNLWASYAERDGVDPSFPRGFDLARRTSVSAESMSSAVMERGESMTRSKSQVPKTENQEARLRAAVLENFIFRSLEPEQYQVALQAMDEEHHEAGDIVIKQGDQGQYFYIVERGNLDVYMQPPHMSAAEALAAPADQLGKKVLSYGPGATFGELALMYMQPRAASVVMTTPGTLWKLDRIAFRTILTELNMDRRMMLKSFLKQVPLLQHLSDAERLRILDAIEIRDYKSDEVIVREGDIGTHFYVIVNGLAEVHKANDAGQPLTMLRRGDYFGELALMRSEPRAATVIVSELSPNKVLRVATLEENAFTRLLGPLTGIMARYAETHYGGPEDDVAAQRAQLHLPLTEHRPGSPRS
ncbi:hypothetical protein MVES1_002844 [Malassezia vespertilionis]|uniref:cAMP-dependent protein kinase regulatory subunit n=1 Tax=Malassezia vespertilionis TaxID=2020962 RepID=A0A2N1J9Z8_9BASI|nr:uncharacterized protein MVES1_002844 [Malassezia vespertilionis]PKI83377.1 hypothetical protein MVES_002689 [Malassezia vespertilionis]WFD07478.1 hypothetical protein MVES1_002844 [Malassezia vespertilionis]